MATPPAHPLVKSGDKDGFRRAFGDRYVDALRTGGEMHVLVRITSSNAEEYNGLAAGCGFKAAYDTAKSNSSSYTEVNIESEVVGDRGEQIH